MIYAVNKRTKEHREVVVPPCPDSADIVNWRFVEADPDGWIPWSFGKCPLPGFVMCETKDEDLPEEDGKPYRAGDIHWGAGTTIIAYRPILDEPRQANLCGALLWQDAEGTIPAYESDPVGLFISNPEPPTGDGEAAEQLCKVYFDIAAEVIGEEQMRIRRDIKLRDAAEKRAKDAIAGEVLEAMDNGLGSCFKDVQIAAVVYAAIRDGKVPGVKLEETS